MVGDFLFELEKVLNITTAEVSAVKAKRFATDQRDRLRFNFADVPGGLLAVYQPFVRDS
jgi:hypothetical protein